jgi:hypothetical protein
VAIWRRLGASAALLVILAAGVAVIGGVIAAVLVLTVDDTPAAEQAAAEAADVEVLSCRTTQRWMGARLRVTNDSAEASDFFIDLAFVSPAGELIETGSAIVEDLPPGEAMPVAVVSAAPAPRRFDCQLGDVDRLAA